MERELSNKEIKAELCLMLKALIEYLEKNDIRYSVVCGTLLGAVRHKGFIPWDDDIDVGIYRDDYDRLVLLLRKDRKISDNLKASGFEIGDGESDWPFIKIYNDKIIVQDKELTYRTKLWVDVFPFDNYHDSVQWFLVRVLRKFFFTKRLLEGMYSHPWKCLKVTRKIAEKLDKQKLTEEYIKLCTKYRDKKCRYIQDMTWGNKKVPGFIFDELEEYEFENMIVKGFKEYDAYLKFTYGDYMEIPPEEERDNHQIMAWMVVNE